MRFRPWRTDTDIRQWLPPLQAHRGYWVAGLQQNSLASVKEAYRRGYKMAEFDVRLTADEIVVLFHDEKYREDFLARTTYEVFKNKIQPEFKQLSRLEEVFQWMQDGVLQDSGFQFKLNIEIKSRQIFDGRLEKQVVQLIQKYRLVPLILISSFNPFSLWRVRLQEPGLRRALLVTNDQESNFLLNAMAFNFLAYPDVLHLRWSDWNEKNRARVKNKVPVVLWTVNEKSYAQEIKNSIFGVISDQLTPQDFS